MDRGFDSGHQFRDGTYAQPTPLYAPIYFINDPGVSYGTTAAYVDGSETFPGSMTRAVPFVAGEIVTPEHQHRQGASDRRDRGQWCGADPYRGRLQWHNEQHQRVNPGLVGDKCGRATPKQVRQLRLVAIPMLSRRRKPHGPG